MVNVLPLSIAVSTRSDTSKTLRLRRWRVWRKVDFFDGKDIFVNSVCLTVLQRVVAWNLDVGIFDGCLTAEDASSCERGQAQRSDDSN